MEYGWMEYGQKQCHMFHMTQWEKDVMGQKKTNEGERSSP